MWTILFQWIEVSSLHYLYLLTEEYSWFSITNFVEVNFFSKLCQLFPSSEWLVNKEVGWLIVNLNNLWSIDLLVEWLTNQIIASVDWLIDWFMTNQSRFLMEEKNPGEIWIQRKKLIPAWCGKKRALSLHHYSGRWSGKRNPRRFNAWLT